MLEKPVDRWIHASGESLDLRTEVRNSHDPLALVRIRTVLLALVIGITMNLFPI